PDASTHPPNIVEFGKWLGYHLTRDWRLMFQAPIAFLAVFVFSIAIAWLLTWNVVVPQKNEQITTKQTIIEGKQTQVDYLSKQLETTQRENDKLSKQIEDLRIYRAQDALPLKKKALILAQQIRDFAKQWKDADSPEVQSQNVFKYHQRFGRRVQIMRDDLDQNGQQSDEFDKVIQNFSSSYQNVITIASEIEKLAKRLPE